VLGRDLLGRYTVEGEASRRTREQPRKRPEERRLPGAGGTDHVEHLADSDRKRDAVEHGYITGVTGEYRAKIGGCEKRVHRLSSPTSPESGVSASSGATWRT
jgi:hypothetical protein